MTFTLPPLPYDYAALEPHVDEQTMRIHHDKHHAAYVNNLNAALDGKSDLQGKTLESLISDLSAVPEGIRHSGPRNLIEAVANGKLAARSIHEFLSPQRAQAEVTLEIEQIPTSRYRIIAGFETLDRETPPTLDVGRRTGIAEVETGYDRGAAWRQAARCLVCHVQTIYDPELCVLCNRGVDICPEHCLAIVPFGALELDEAARAALVERAGKHDLPLSAMVKDDDRCIRCGLCAVRCPPDAMTMERFQITERFQEMPRANRPTAASSAEVVRQALRQWVPHTS